MKKVGVLFLSTFCLASLGFSVTVTSTFDSSSDGWTTFQIAGGVSWFATGGNPNGHITAADDQTGWGYFKAPTSYTSHAAVYGSSLSFDLKHTSSNGTPTLYKIRAAIIGAGIVLINESVLPTAQWQTYSFVLNETSGWRNFSNVNQNYSTGAPLPTLSEMQSVLSSMTSLYIAADYNDETTPPRDLTYLDNVSMEVVPEPTTIAALGTGMMLVLRRRRSA